MMIIIRPIPAFFIHINGMISISRLNFYLEQWLVIRPLNLRCRIVSVHMIRIVDTLVYNWGNFAPVYLPVCILVVAMAVIIGIHIPVFVILVVCMPLIVG